MTRSHRHLALAAALAALPWASRAAEAPPAQAVPQIERIALFKNGLGYATATARLPEKAKVVNMARPSSTQVKKCLTTLQMHMSFTFLRSKRMMVRNFMPHCLCQSYSIHHNVGLIFSCHPNFIMGMKNTKATKWWGMILLQ